VKWLLAHEYNVRLLIGDMVDTRVVEEFKLLLARSVEWAPDRILDEPVASVEDLLSQIAATDFVVATRFHNVLLSLLLNKPVIAIAFHHKCSSLMQQMGLSDYCEDINGLTADGLIKQFCQLQQNVARVKQLTNGRLAICRQALDEQYANILQKVYPGSQFSELSQEVTCASKAV
jgi:polysaccharide pyruvyl transferase WcaK-like protein